MHIYKDYCPVIGGIENHLRLLAEAQVEQGLEVTVLVTSLTTRTEIQDMNGVRVIKAARLATLASTPLSLSLPSVLRRLKPDITHLHSPYPLGELAQLYLGRSNKTVITYHSDIVRQRTLLHLYAPFLRRVLAKADRIIATSPQYVRTSPYLSQWPDKCQVIPYGIDVDRFLGRDRRRVEETESRYGHPLLIFVGQLRYYKGLEVLVEAMTRVEAKVLIIGGGGPVEREKLSRLVAERGVEEKIYFIGEQEANLPAYYQACDLLVLPSTHRSEAFGIVQLEAMACGKPVICTELSTGTSYVNIDGQTGLVVPPRDPSALAGAIQRLLADPGLREEMGRRARERVAQEFTLQKMVDRILALYEALLSA